MRRFWTLAVVAVVAALFGGAAIAGGILCMLRGRDVTLGTVKSTPRDGLCQVAAEGGSQSFRIGEKGHVVRIERIRAEEIRPGDEFIALNGKNGSGSPAVVVYRDQNDLWTLYQAVGHGTKRGAAQARR